MKLCSDCGLEKLLIEFTLVNRNKNITHYGERTYKSICKLCNAKRQKEYAESHRDQIRAAKSLWNKTKKKIRQYNITQEDLDKINNTSECEICEHQMVTPQIDHDKVSEAFRGVLCMQCNLMIGLAMHDSRILRQAAEYLDKFNSSRTTKAL